MPVQLQPLSLYNVSEAQQQGQELDQLLRLDFSSISAYLRQHLPNTDAPLRKIPFVRRYVEELGGLYQRPVVRRFLSPTDPQALPQAAWRKMVTVYDEARADAAMSVVESGLWVHQTMAAMVLPDGAGISILPVSPWQMEPKILDTLRPWDVAGWESVKITVPDTIDADTGVITWGTIELTRTEAWRYVRGSKIGIYAPNGSHPFGKVPLVLGHRVAPELGRWCAPLNEPVHNLQIALCLLESETELVIRHSAWPQKVLENATIAQMTEQIQVGPDKVVALLRSGDPNAPGPALRVVQGQLPVTELTTWIEGRIKLYCAMLGIDPSAFLRVNTAVTVSARLFAHATRAEMRDRIRPVLERFERELAKLSAQVLNLTGIVSLPVDTLTVDLRWQDTTTTIDPVADTTAISAAVKLGLRSVVEEVAQRDGLSIAAARVKVDANLQEARELGFLETAAPTVSAVTDTASVAVEAEDVLAEGAPVQDTALNGAQVQQLVAIVQQVGAGQLAPDAAASVITLAFPLLDPAKVGAMVQRAAAFQPRPVVVE